MFSLNQLYYWSYFMWYYVIPNQYLKPVPTSYPDLDLSVYKCIKITYSTSHCRYPILMIMSYEACIRCFHSAELFLFVLRHLSITGILALSERCKSFKTACRNRELIFNIVKYSYLMLIPGVEYWISRPPGSNQKRRSTNFALAVTHGGGYSYWWKSTWILST